MKEETKHGRVHEPTAGWSINFNELYLMLTALSLRDNTLNKICPTIVHYIVLAPRHH